MMSWRSVPWLVAATGCLASDPPTPAEPTDTVAQGLVDAGFTVRGLAGKCIAASAGNRLELRTCDGSAAQSIRVVEQAQDHLVELRQGTLCAQPLVGFPIAGVALELVTCSGAASQRWMLDGDSIRLGPQLNDPFPDLVVAVHDHSGADGSPLTLESRRLDESDYWEVAPSQKGITYPTSGFVAVSDEAGLITALASATPGTVVDLAPTAAFELHRCSVSVGPRVTVRSGGRHAGRRTTHVGGGARIKYAPFLYCLDADNPTAFWVAGEGARLTGFRLEGLSIDAQDSAPRTYGILVDGVEVAYPSVCDGKSRGLARHVEIDHMELTGWKEGGVGVYGHSSRVQSDDGTAPIWDDFDQMWVGGDWHPLAACRCDATPTDGVSVRVARNYIHHNRNPDGYGVVVTYDGHALIEGNTFLHNRHAIAATGQTGPRYFALGNLVQSHGENEQDFDVHGSAGCAGGARGGVAGERIDVVANTFLGNDRNNLYLRGTSCQGARYAGNVTRQQESAGPLETVTHSRAVHTTVCPWEPPVNLTVTADNRYEIADPTAKLAVGDFNGDGRDDLLMATGAAYYVSFDGQTAWQLRGYGTEQLDELLLGDFDGDHRTDLIRNNPSGAGIQIRFGGEGDWINKRPDVRLPDLLAGDFDGDGRDDLIWTTGTDWRFSKNGSAAWTVLRADTRRAGALRVGRFDADASADVFATVPVCGLSGGCWMAYPGGAGAAVLLGPARAALSTLSIADVDGDGRDDVVSAAPIIGGYAISVSLRGTQPLATWALSGSGKPGAVGKFTGAPASLLAWDSLAWNRVPYGQPAQPWAWYEMF